MDIYMPVSTTVRHNEIISTFSGDILQYKRKKEVYSFQEECATVHWGYKTKPDILSLIDVSKITDIKEFKEITINELDYVMPDFILFKNNP